MNDLRFAFRQLLKNPGFTAVAVLTVAMGIGATTAILSVVNAVILRPLTYPEADRLVRLHETVPARQVEKVPVAVPNFLDWQQQCTAFEGIAAHQWSEVNLTGRGAPRRLRGARTTANLVPLLGIGPVLGRLFAAEEEPLGKYFVALISHDLWQRDFGGDASVIGLVIGLAGGLAVARLLAGLLYEIQPHDPPTFGGVTVLLAAVAMLACWIPARRAARVDPMIALRNE